MTALPLQDSMGTLLTNTHLYSTIHQGEYILGATKAKGNILQKSLKESVGYKKRTIIAQD